MMSFNRENYKVNTTSIFLGAVLLMASCVYSQDNYRLENFGNRSILLNGNVTGSVDDLGVSYYNPARLSFIENKAFTINAKVYEFSSIKFEDYFGRGFDSSESSFNGLPTMIAGTFKVDFLPNHSFAYSLISRTRDDRSIRFNSGIINEDVVDEYPGEELFNADIKLDSKLTDEWIGLTWSTKLANNFSVGASLFYSNYESSGTNEIRYLAFAEEEQVGNYSNFIRYRQKSKGLLGKVAAAWIFPKVSLGINIDLPYVQLGGSGALQYDELLSGFGPGLDIFTLNDFNDLEAKRRIPMNVSLGAGIDIKKHRLHVSGTWHAAQKEYDVLGLPQLDSETSVIPELSFSEEFKSVINFGVGAEVYVSDKIGMYASYSSDFSPVVTNAILSDLTNNEGEDINFNANYSHLGFGVDLKTKWLNLLLGTVYSTAKGRVTSPIDIPLNPPSITNNNSRISIDRWRVVLGFEVFILEKAKEELGL